MKGIAGDRVRVLLVDDSEDFRSGLSKLLAATCDVVGMLEDGVGVEQAVEQLCPDVVVLDISMTKMNGFEAARKLLAVYPDAKIIFLTSHTDSDLQQEASAIGAQGFVHKSRAVADLPAAVRVVRDNGKFFSELG